MEDFYIEQIVSKKANGGLIGLAKTGWLVLTIFILLTGILSGNFIFMIIGLIVGFGGYYFILPMLQVEYEYLYMNKEFSVDRIFSKEKRKKGGSWDLSKVEVIAPYGHDILKNYANRKCETLDFTSGISNDRCYVLLINDKDLIKLLIEPNDEMIKKFRDQFPRQFAR